LPDSKTGAKVVYAGSIVMDLLAEIKNHSKRPEANPYVIWGKKPGTCLNNLQKAWKRFCKLADLQDLHIHDLRHSFASFAVNKGTSLAMIGKLLGHTQTQTTARYAHLMAEPMIKTAENITTEISRLLKVHFTEKTPAIKLKPDNLTDDLLTRNSTTIKAPVYLTSEQAAKYLGVKPSTLIDWRYKKTGPSFERTYSKIYYKLDVLEEFIRSTSIRAK
jgi:DNA-binding transcriptional MerR regulator